MYGLRSLKRTAVTTRDADERHLTAVRKKLDGYAERGIFHSYEERGGRSGHPEFHFVWLQDFPVTLICDLARQTLTLRDLFPEIPHRSEIDTDLRRFVQSRQDDRLPPPRRIDPQRVGLRCFNRDGKLSVELKVNDHQYRYAATKAVNLAQELYNYLSANHVEYMWETFNLPEE
jgi:hypothetical protein